MAAQVGAHNPLLDANGQPRVIKRLVDTGASASLLRRTLLFGLEHLFEEFRATWHMGGGKAFETKHRIMINWHVFQFPTCTGFTTESTCFKAAKSL